MAIFNRALLHDKLGDLKAAIRDYTTVINQFPNFWTGLSYRAGCYRKLGMTAKAELDEFRIFKAQMNKHLGIQPRWSAKTKKELRKRSEVDPNKYASIVVDDAPKYEHEYKSEYRGKVQNRVVEAGYLPMYQLSYFPKHESLSTIQAYDKEVDAFNMSLDKSSKHKLYIVCSKEQLDEKESMDLFSMIDRLSAELSVAKSDEEKTQLLLRRAVAHSVLRDFEAAISDFTEYMVCGGKNSIAYWQRAVCQTELDEFNLSEGKGITNLHSSEADFSDAIRLNGSNAFVYYNRGNLHAGRNELSKAIDDYSIAIRLDANLAEAYYNRGIARSKAGNKPAAIQDLSKAGELGLYDAYAVIKRLNKQK